MTRTISADNLPPFPADYRAAGVLLHVTSLPTHYGIGDLGPAAHAWIDQLHQAGQSWWQALPTGPTGYADSPYQALSSFAGNGLLISPDFLLEEGLLGAADCAPGHVPPSTAVDYPTVMSFKRGLLEPLYIRFTSQASPGLKNDFECFCQKNADWLDDYALFRTLKALHHDAHYLHWPAPLVQREPAALAQARNDHACFIDSIRLAQFLMFRQAKRLKQHAHARGIRLVGDLPFFVSPDSSDVWSHPELFLLDEHFHPRAVAGVPPDAFSADGQRWGNPLYNWDALRQTGFRWCIQRIRALLNYVDVIRLDHFRAFAAAWHIPADSHGARHGQWVPGPGAPFFHAVQRELGALPFIAEDLGLITPDVLALLDQFHLPGNRVLQFAFDGDPANPHLPENHTHNTVAYTATHDNPTTRQWFDELTEHDRRALRLYLGHAVAPTDAAGELIQLAWSSRAALAIVPMQDLLNLGAEGRMNRPGSPDGNWRWRCTHEMCLTPAWEKLTQWTFAAARQSALTPETHSANGTKVQYPRQN